jgi:hypothetical protein
MADLQVLNLALLVIPKLRPKLALLLLKSAARLQWLALLLRLRAQPILSKRLVPLHPIQVASHQRLLLTMLCWMADLQMLNLALLVIPKLRPKLALLLLKSAARLQWLAMMLLRTWS